MTWGDDDVIYASSGDPNWGGKRSGLDIERFDGAPPGYTITRVNPMDDYTGFGGAGPKPTGMISVKGVLYLAFQNLLGGYEAVPGAFDQAAGEAMIVSSRDHGKSWTPSIKDVKEPMFPGDRFGGPAFVNSGKDNANAPDDYVYAVSTTQWDNGNDLRVGRVLADRIQDRNAWEWISELKDTEAPIWTNDLRKAIPVLYAAGRISAPEMVYIAQIRRYVLLTWHLKRPLSPSDGTELTIYEGLHAWGPFTVLHHESLWETRDMTPYCPRLPLKWITVRAGVIDGWIQFSGSWREGSSHYRSHVRRFRMTFKAPQPTSQSAARGRNRPPEK